MEKYVDEALLQGYIYPSTSPAAYSFFFVAKKDGGLQPCSLALITGLSKSHCQVLLPTSPHPSHFGTVKRCSHLHQTIPQKCVKPHPLPVLERLGY